MDNQNLQDNYPSHFDISTSSLWLIELGDPPGELQTLRPEDMLFYEKKTENSECIETWKGHNSFGRDFEVTVITRTLENGFISTRLGYRNYSGPLQVEQIKFPIIRETADTLSSILIGNGGIGVLLKPEVICKRHKKEDPRVFSNSATNMNALLRKDGSGLYMDIRDTANLTARQYEVFASDDESTIIFRTIHLLALDEKPVKEWMMEHENTLGNFTGSWFDAAQIYRKWALEQWWVKQRSKQPNPLRGLCLWLWNRGTADTVLPPTFKIKEDLGDIPIALDWYWWHQNPYDSDYPNFWPPRDGEENFKNAVAQCRERGIFTQVYINGVCWDMDTFNWEDGGSAGVVHKRDGQPKSYAFNCYNHHRLAWQCGESEIFHDKLREVVRKLHDSGLSGQYLDMIGGFSTLPCYNPAHKHRPGAGEYMARGFRKMLSQIKAENPDYPLSSEECNERFMDLLDGIITLIPSFERLNRYEPDHEPVPLFTAIYHGKESVACFGNYALPDGKPPYDTLWPEDGKWKEEKPWHKLFPDQFQLEFARCIVWGVQPMICNFKEHIYQDPEFADIYKFILDGVRFYHANQEFLFDGTMASPDGFKCADHTMRFMSRFIFTPEGKETCFDKTLPAVLHGVWISPAGEKALFLVNYTANQQEWSFNGCSGKLEPRSFAKITL